MVLHWWEQGEVKLVMPFTGMGILQLFPHLRIFFSVLPIFRISEDFCSFEL